MRVLLRNIELLCVDCGEYFLAKRSDAMRCAGCRYTDQQKRGVTYYTSGKGRGHSRAKSRVRMLERQTWLNELKAGPCTDCGVGYLPVVMQFDHVRGQKTANIGKLLIADKHYKAVILREIENCDLVCANCHFVREWYRNLYMKGT